MERKDFTFGLFGCFDDFGTCINAWCCPCCLAAQNSARADHYSEGVCCCCCYPMAGPAKLRNQAITQLTLAKPQCSDCLITSCCCWCSNVQIKKEMDWREQNPMAPKNTQFQYGLCDCCSPDPMQCVYAYFCFCCQHSATSARLDGFPNFGMCCYECQGGKVRAQIRGQRRLGPPQCCPDYLVWCCCNCCSEVQLKRELDERDKSEQAMVMYAQQATMVPVGVVMVGVPVQQGMQ
jgi:Cys-rich protein (TIGR01571 family)